MTHQSPPDKLPIEFEEITLTLTGQTAGKDLSVPNLEVTAFAGKATGLAFHQVVEETEAKTAENPLEDEDWEAVRYGYAVTQIHSGRRLGRGWVDTPRQAKLWIELLSNMADWRKDINELVNGADRSNRLKRLAARVEQARLDAIDRCLFVESSE